MSEPSENITLLRNIYSMVRIQKQEIFLLKNEIKCLKNLIVTMNNNVSELENNSIKKQQISSGWIWS